MFFACRFVVHNSLWFWQLPSGREAYQTNVPLTACIIRLHLVCSWNFLPFPRWTGKLTLHFKPTGNPAPAMLYFHADSFKFKIHLFFFYTTAYKIQHDFISVFGRQWLQRTPDSLWSHRLDQLLCNSAGVPLAEKILKGSAGTHSERGLAKLID